MKNIWFQAIVSKYRYNTTKGPLNSEQLVTVEYAVLKALYIALQQSLVSNKGIKTLDGGKVKSAPGLKNKIAIVKEIYEYRTQKEAEGLRKRGNLELANKMLREADMVELQELTEGLSSAEIRESARRVRAGKKPL